MAQISVSIRPLAEDDGEAVERYASDPKVAETTTVPHPYPKGGGENFVRACLDATKQRASFSFAIVLNEELIGVIGINRVDFETSLAHIDYGIGSAHWGKGIMTNAVALTLAHAFEELELEMVRSSCLERNVGSRRVLEKNGFEFVERFVHRHPKFEGERALRFQLTREAWQVQRKA